MQQRILGSSGFKVGAVGLGCMGMSFAYDAGNRDDSESLQVIHRAIDLGVTLIDTADVYGPFTNEKLVGQALAGRRDQVTLASKCGLVIKNGEITPYGHPDHIRHAAEASLQRLGVETIDLYQLHRVDPTIPYEDTWGAMAELVKAGSVRAIGLSEVTAEQLTAAHAIHPVATVQSELSLWSTDQLDEVVPWCRANGAAFIPYAPLGRGFLTGALSSADQLESSDWRNPTRGSVPNPSMPISASSTSSARWRPSTVLPRPRSRWPGYWASARTSFRFPVPNGCDTWKRTSPR
jgi:aryl-alcohol dehydrogenase-like predicted oxidoreductase